MQKRVLYVYQHDYPWEVRVEKITQSLVDAGYEVMVLCRWNGTTLRQTDTFGAVHIHRVGFGESRRLYEPTSYNPLWRKALQRVVDEFKPTIIMPREILLAQACAAAVKNTSCAVVMDMAEDYPASMKLWRKYSDNIVLRAAVHWFDIPTYVEKKSVALCDGILTCAQDNSQHLWHEYSYPFAQQCVVHNTPRLSDMATVQKGIIRPRHELIFSHCGYITAVRNIPITIAGFSLACTRNTSTQQKLMIAGMSDPTLEHDVDTAIEHSPVRQSIIRKGKYTYEQIPSLYSQTDVGLVPYLYCNAMNHTLPNKVFDNLVCGKPMIVSMVEPLKRIVEETKAGIAIDCTSPESIASGIEYFHSLDLETMSANARTAGETLYHWDIDAARMIAFLDTY